MNVCGKNRKGLALLAIGSLDDEAEGARLRAHAEVCAGCREYLSQMQEVAGVARDAVAPEEMEASLRLRRQVRLSLRSERPRTVGWWRLGIPAFAAMIFCVVIWPKWRTDPPQRTVDPSPGGTAANAPLPRRLADFAPTIMAYQLAAGHSADALDKLLKEQATQAVAAAPVYRAASLAEP